MDEANPQWLLGMLATIRTRPGAFLGDERVSTLRAFLAGYEQGREDAGLVGMHKHDSELLERFDRWLGELLEVDISQGASRWPQLVAQIDSGAQNALTFFRLLTQFLNSVGIDWEQIPYWAPKGNEPSSRSIRTPG